MNRITRPWLFCNSYQVYLLDSGNRFREKKRIPSAPYRGGTYDYTEIHGQALARQSTGIWIGGGWRALARGRSGAFPRYTRICRPYPLASLAARNIHKRHGDAALARVMVTGAAQQRFLDGVALSATALRPKGIAA